MVVEYQFENDAILIHLCKCACVSVSINNQHKSAQYHLGAKVNVHLCSGKLITIEN